MEKNIDTFPSVEGGLRIFHAHYWSAEVVGGH